MHFCFSWSSIKFPGHTGWKVDDLNPIWVRLLGRPQLSNPSDLPCCFIGFVQQQMVIYLWYVYDITLVYWNWLSKTAWWKLSYNATELQPYRSISKVARCLFEVFHASVQFYILIIIIDAGRLQSWLATLRGVWIYAINTNVCGSN